MIRGTMAFRLALASGLALVTLTQVTTVQAQKYGGTLEASLGGNPASLSIHEEATVYTAVPMQPLFSNLVYYDPMQAQESLETIIPELAESWRWNAERTVLSFALRRGVRFHDGKPFTSADVKHTFDTVRGATPLRLKLNPRKPWYANVAEVASNGDHEVAFRLRRPQPALLAMLASGYSPIMPAHRSPAEWRGSPVGTGPFALKEYQRDRYVLLERNATYWVPSRPYLNGVRFSIIPNQGSRIAAMKAQQVDIDNPSDATKPVMEALVAAAPELKFMPVTSLGFPALHFNTKKAPFNNPELRRAVSLAIDRDSLVKGLFRGGMVLGGINLPPPTGVWGLGAAQLADLPGYGDPQKARAEARRIMASLGYSAERPLSTLITTRLFRNFADVAAWLAGELKEVWIVADVRLIETGVYYGTVSRREFSILLHPTGIGVDDPDVNFYENYTCDSQRNYSDYCNREVQALVDEQSQTTDPAQRLALVQRIDRRLLSEVARGITGWYIFYHARQPYVRNYIPHQSNYNFGRLQEVWLDK